MSKEKYPGCIACYTGAVGMNPQAYDEIVKWHHKGHPATGQVMSPQAILRTPDVPKASSPSETQLTLQELRERVFDTVKHFKLTKKYGINPDLPTDEIMEAFTQALTTLKSEMEGLKRRGDMSDHYLGARSSFNEAISECQKLLEQKIGESK